MEDRTIRNLKKLSLILAKYSFILGSAIFFSFIITGIHELKILGFIYNIIACMINGAAVFSLLILIMLYPKRYWEILECVGILLFNIPAALLYLFLLPNF